MIKVLNNELVFRKAQHRIDQATEAFPVIPNDGPRQNRVHDGNYENRANALYESTGMTMPYLSALAKGKYEQPSGRVLNNLGIEVWYKDIETGEMMKAELLGRCEVDHSQPTNPRFIRD